MAATPAVPAAAGVAFGPISTWEVTTYEPEYGPPKPGACIHGWASHTWTISFDYSSWSLTCDCKLCTDGFSESDAMESIVGEIPVRIAFDSDHGPEGKGLGGWHYDTRCDCNWWWEVRPA